MSLCLHCFAELVNYVLGLTDEEFNRAVRSGKFANSAKVFDEPGLTKKLRASREYLKEATKEVIDGH